MSIVNEAKYDTYSNDADHLVALKLQVKGILHSARTCSY